MVRISPEEQVTKDVRIIIEQHPDGFVAYPVGLRGVIVGEGDTREEAIADVTSAIQFHVETFGTAELEDEEPLLDVFLADVAIIKNETSVDLLVPVPSRQRMDVREVIRQLREFRRGITPDGLSTREMIEEDRRG